MFFFHKSKILYPYVIRDEYHNIVGIRDDAPEEAKEAYKEYKEIMDQAKKDGCKL